MPLLRGWPDRAFHLAVTDPPYFSGPEKRKFYGNAISPISVKRVNYPVTPNWELPTIEYFEQLKRVSTDWIIWGFNYFDFCHLGKFPTPRRGDIKRFIEENPRGWIIWDKVNGSSSFNDFELAFTSFDLPTEVFTFMWNGMMQGKSITEGHLQRGNKRKNQARIHPTEKPFELYRWIWWKYTTLEMKVLDTHLGSGASIVGAMDFDLHFTGIEIDETHFANAEHRFKQMNVPKLFSFT